MTKREEVTTGQVIRACEALGLDAHNVLEVHVYAEQIRVVEFIRDENGRPYLDDTGTGFAKNSRILHVKWGRS